MNSTGTPEYGEPEVWEFDYPWDIVQTAIWLWSMSQFQRLPSQEEVMAYDPRYISDIRLAYHIYSHQGNQSAPMQLLQQWESFNSDPEAYEAQRQAQVMKSQDDSADPSVLANRATNKPAGKGNFISRK